MYYVLNGTQSPELRAQEVPRMADAVVGDVVDNWMCLPSIPVASLPNLCNEVFRGSAP